VNEAIDEDAELDEDEDEDGATIHPPSPHDETKAVGLSAPASFPTLQRRPSSTSLPVEPRLQRLRVVARPNDPQTSISPPLITPKWCSETCATARSLVTLANYVTVLVSDVPK
jgi:hypothetical protein